MLDKEIILVGYSGHGYVVAEAALTSYLNLKYYAEKNKLQNNPFGLSYIGFEGNDLFKGFKGNYSFILGIGDNKIRQKIARKILKKSYEIQNVFHNSASIGQKVTIGKGNFIARNVAINSLAKIGNYCILNTGCIIEHECVISDAVHIGPGAVLAGNVSVGERTFIGANSVVKQGVKLGEDVIVGAGSVVIKDVPNGKKVVGNPSREI